jgi:hypothetical protein
MDLLGDEREKDGDPRHSHRKSALKNERRHATAMLLGWLHASLTIRVAAIFIVCCVVLQTKFYSLHTAPMSQRRISPIERKKSSSRKSKARLARKAEMLKKIAGKKNRVHRKNR